MPSLEERLRNHALALGFDRAGIAPATAADGFDRLSDWLARGLAGDMAYMARHKDARRHPSSILPTVRSIVMLAQGYGPLPSAPPGTARIARYAQGADYHDVLRSRLNALLAWVQEQVPGCRGRGVVDTAPLLERDFARRAGLGWFGKNTMLLDRRHGSTFLLAALLLDLDLQADPPHASSHCGTCTACLDACPTAAFPEPGLLDSRRCLSYLTIELKGPIPDDLRPAVRDWVFGCDVCQEVCPWNRKAPPGRDPALAPRPELAAPDLLEWFSLSGDGFRRRFRDTALGRSKRQGLLRNAALVLGNRGDPAAIPVLSRAADDPDPVIRDAARWALDRLRDRPSDPANPP